MIPSTNSTDLDMGRRPELKSVEFFEGIILAFEIFTILCLKPLKKCYTVWEHDPHASVISVSTLYDHFKEKSHPTI